MEYVYHGSSVPHIEKLEARSKLHGTNEEIVYLTGSIPYALMYIWDEKKLGTSQKHVTCGIKDGIVMYQEQFPNQLETFYKGVKGYLYCVNKDSYIQTVENRENMYYTLENVKVDEAVVIEDVYEEFLKYEKEGQLKVFRFNDLSQDDKHQMTMDMANYFKKMNLYQDDEQKVNFFKYYFKEAWKLANNL